MTKSLPRFWLRFWSRFGHGFSHDYQSTSISLHRNPISVFDRIHAGFVVVHNRTVTKTVTRIGGGILSLYNPDDSHRLTKRTGRAMNPSRDPQFQTSD